MLPTIFDLFTQVDRSWIFARRLGLVWTLVRRVTEMHGGRWKRQRRDWQGIEFVVRLPLWSGDSPMAARV